MSEATSAQGSAWASSFSQAPAPRSAPTSGSLQGSAWASSFNQAPAPHAEEIRPALPAYGEASTPQIATNAQVSPTTGNIDRGGADLNLNSSAMEAAKGILPNTMSEGRTSVSHADLGNVPLNNASISSEKMIDTTSALPAH